MSAAQEIIIEQLRAESIALVAERDELLEQARKDYRRINGLVAERDRLREKQDEAYGAMRAARMALTIGQPGHADKLLAAVLKAASGAG